MKKVGLNIPKEILIKEYLELGSSYRIADKYEVSATAVKRVLKELGVLRTQSEAAKVRDNSHCGKYERTEEHKGILKECGKQRTGEKNPFYKKTHSKESIQKIGLKSKERTGIRNPNYKDGKYVRRPRDFKIAEFTPIRNFVFNRDKYTCQYCKVVGGHLHAHHILPYWVKPEAFLDSDNLVTVCSDCHFEKAHLKNWHHFDVSFITENLITKYSLNRERLNELALWKTKGCDSLNYTHT